MKKLIALLACFFLCLCVFALIVIAYISKFQPFRIAGDSMSPSYLDGEYYLARKDMTDNLQRGDVIVYQPINSDSMLISRVVGLPNEKVEFIDNSIYIDGEKLSEDMYLGQFTQTSPGDKGNSFKLGGLEFFVLGDNRDDSLDSRDLGPIKLNQIKGKVTGDCYYNCQERYQV